jgi:hypothetical protein
MPNGKTESIRWDELREVGIVTTDEGPWAADVFWLLLCDGVGCAVPSEAQGARTLLERLSELPGFDARAVIEAMGCTDNDCCPPTPTAVRSRFAGTTPNNRCEPR